MTTEAAVWWALVAVEAAALALAALLAWRSAAVRPLAGLVACALVNEVAVEAIRLHLAAAARPFAGLHLALFHLSHALVLGWPAALAAASWVVFAAPRFDLVTKRLRRPLRSSLAVLLIAAAWLGWLLALAFAYPLPRETTARVLHAFEAGCVAVALAPIPLARRLPWGVAHVGVGLLASVELAVAAIGPWARDPYRDWVVASAGYLVGFGSLSAYLLASAVRGARRRSAPKG